MPEASSQGQTLGRGGLHVWLSGFSWNVAKDPGKKLGSWNFHKYTCNLTEAEIEIIHSNGVKALQGRGGRWGEGKGTHCKVEMEEERGKEGVIHVQK